jgi:hypothetical protein
MTQTAFQCLSRSGTNKEKRKQDSGDFSHGIKGVFFYVRNVSAVQ